VKAPLVRYRGVRYRADTGFELRCDDCAESGGVTCYWPITLEYWNPSAGMGRCRACWLAEWRRRQRAHRASDLEARRAHDRRRYHENRRVILLKRRVHYEENRELILAKARERYQRRKAA
jgi:hypothetical protein